MLRTRLCKAKAVWRLRLGKPPESLAVYYRLPCEYGTILMTCWQGGGSGPLYVCNDHARELGNIGSGIGPSFADGRETDDGKPRRQTA
jgi:hypothetical protein